jgi:hypothetical protein
VVRLYGIRHWIEQSYKEVKTELGWADFQVRSDVAIRRHQTLLNCAFSFCWNAWFDQPSTADRQTPTAAAAEPPNTGPVERGRRTRTAETQLAQGITPSPRMAHTMDTVTALLESLVGQAPTR